MSNLKVTDLNQYQKLASRTAKSGMLLEQQAANFCLGLAGESGEVVDYMKKVIFHGHDFDRDNLKKELGDTLWYLSQLANMFDITMEEIATANIEKLMKRYPEGFNSGDSIARKE